MTDEFPPEVPLETEPVPDPIIVPPVRGRSRAVARKRRARRRALVAVLLVLVLLVAGVLGSIGWYRTQLSAASGSHAPIEVTVPKGFGTAQIGKLLAQRQIIRNAGAFTWHVRFSDGGSFEAGRYRFKRNSSVDDAIAVLDAGPLAPVTVKVNFPEGYRIDQIVLRIHERVPRFSEVSIRAALKGRAVTAPMLPSGSNDYEGLLFPATYEVTEKMSAVDLLQQMADALSNRQATLGLDAGAASQHITPYQLVIVASLVQAEAGNPDEAPKIARVIYNRLAQGQPLGIDATSRYLSIISGNDVDFESSSPFNTRRNPGLPPTPIAAPGDFALNAALHPAEGDWLYYVRDVANDAKGRPQHVFTASAEAFAEAKRACHDAGLGCGAP